MDNEMHSRVRGLLKHVTRQPVDGIGADDDLFAKGVLDSFGMIEFLGVVEKDFDCTVPEGELTPENFRSLRSISGTLVRLGVGADSAQG